jgi:LysM repeat protein
MIQLSYHIKKRVQTRFQHTRFFGIAILSCLLSTQVIYARPPILKGSSESLDVQNRQAQKHQLKYHKTSNELYQSVSQKKLVAVSPSKSLELAGVSFPFALETTRDFLKGFSKAYQAYCQEALIVTSLTRPNTHQPKNASIRSVHPTGLAIDLRIPSTQKCKAWLVDALVYLEEQKVVEATQERKPPHFHLVVFPNAYQNFVAQKKQFGKRYDQLVSDEFSNKPTQGEDEKAQQATQEKNDEQQALNHSEGQWIESDQELIVLAPESTKAGQQKASAEQDELVRQIEEAEDIRGFDASQEDDSNEDALASSQQENRNKANVITPTEAITQKTVSNPAVKTEAVITAKITQNQQASIKKAEGSTQNKLQSQSVKVSKSQAGEQVYVIKKGDNLWNIARKYNVSVDQIMKYNQLKNDALSLNQKIKIPRI